MKLFQKLALAALFALSFTPMAHASSFDLDEIMPTFGWEEPEVIDEIMPTF
jgi:hypothetical protein